MNKRLKEKAPHESKNEAKNHRPPFALETINILFALEAENRFDWGPVATNGALPPHQLTVEAAEFLCLEIAMIVFYVIEYTEMKEAGLMKRTPNWQADAIEVDRLKVKSGYEDELSDDQDVDAYTGMRKELKPKALKTIHTMEKLLASLLTKKNALEGGYEDTLQEIEYLHERELMLRFRRRCMSFRIERPEFREAWGFESDENDEGDKNYISEPGSPRSKEML